MTKKPHIAITLGDPRGVGEEIIQKSLSDPDIKDLAHWEIFGCSYSPKLDAKEAGRQSILAIEEASHSVLSKKSDAIVTAPISKETLKLNHFSFPGHTEFFVEKFRENKFAMMLASPKLRVVLSTIHIPLKEVFNQLNSNLILEKIQLTHQSLIQDFGISSPKIAICGLNPHAGENGLIGDEEKNLIVPAIEEAKNQNINAIGPRSADTIFHEAISGQYDAVICHYHDQGLIPIKTIDFDRGVNLTIGTHYIRTSPDHGPAFNIAGKNQASPNSMKEALKLAVKIYKNRKNID